MRTILWVGAAFALLGIVAVMAMPPACALRPYWPTFGQVQQP